MPDQHEPPNMVIFIGPPGAGKTACARALGRLLGWEFVDSDRLIEAETGMTVPQIFEQLGEAKFRSLETSLLDRLAKQRTGAPAQPMVMATGGGMPVTPGNFERLQALGEVVALGADLEVLAARLLAEGGRPLLEGTGASDPRPASEILKEKLTRLLSQRASVYARARYKLDTEGLSPEYIAEEVLKRLGLTS